MKHRARSYSDTAPVTPEKKQRSAGNKLSDPGALIAVPTPTAGDLADARSYLNRKGHADLLQVLGLDEPVVTGPITMVCPTCSHRVGVPCETTGGGALGRPHVARKRVWEAAQNERQAADELLDEILAEARAAS